MNQTYVFVSERIRKYRRDNGISQQVLADLLGVTPQTVSKWEQRKSCPDILLLPRIAQILSCSIDDFFEELT